MFANVDVHVCMFISFSRSISIFKSFFSRRSHFFDVFVHVFFISFQVYEYLVSFICC